MGGADADTAVPLPHTMEEEMPKSSSVEPLTASMPQQKEEGREGSPSDVDDNRHHSNHSSAPAIRGDAPEWMMEVGKSSEKISDEEMDEDEEASDWLGGIQIGGESKAQNRIGRFVEGPKCTLAITGLIIVNAMYIGIETDMNTGQDSSTGGWYAVECCFTILFTMELALRMYGLRIYFFWNLDGSPDGWNLFDLVLVSTAVCDTFILAIVTASSQQDGESDTLDVISAMRVARLLRLARIFRLLRFFKELWLLVSGFVNSIRTLAWAWLLIVLIIYIFGILATRTLGQQYGCRVDSSKGCDPEMDEYFGTVPESMFTFFQMITTEGWAQIARRSMGHLTASWIIFICFMSLTTFAIMNVVMAVIVEDNLNQAMAREDDVAKKLDKERHNALHKIYEVFLIADKDHSGELTKEEFLEALHNADVMKLLHEVGIDMRGAEGLFDILDYDESGNLDVTEFIEGCMRARGDAKAKDILALQCDLWRTQQWVRNELQQMTDTVFGRFCKLEAEIHSISSCFIEEEVPTLQEWECAGSTDTWQLAGDRNPEMNAPVGLNSKRASHPRPKASPRTESPRS